MFMFTTRPEGHSFFHYAGRLVATLITVALIGGAAYLVKVAWQWAF